MAYAQTQRANQKLITLGAVSAIHIIVIYALVSGLAATFVRDLPLRLGAYDVKTEMPLDPLPPPPVADPVPVQPATAPAVMPTLDLTPSGPIQLPIIDDIILPASDVAPYTPPIEPPAPRFTPIAAAPKSSPSNWVTQNDYPARALREGREGVTRFTLAIGADGRVDDCRITGSSGHADLDRAACKGLTRRARFNPALGGNGEKTNGSYTSAIRWVIPQ